MPANTNPIFVLTPNTGIARIAAANTASDGSGTTVTCFTAGANGSRVDEIRVTNSQAAALGSSAMVIRIFIYNGTSYRLLAEQALATASRSTTVVGAAITFSFPGGLLLSSGQSLTCCQSVYAGVQDQNDVIVRGGDY